MTVRNASMRTKDGEARRNEGNTWATDAARHRFVHLSDNCIKTATQVSNRLLTTYYLHYL